MSPDRGMVGGLWFLDDFYDRLKETYGVTPFSVGTSYRVLAYILGT